MFKVDTTSVKQFEHDLQRFAARAYPFATRNTVNRAAFATQKTSRRNVTRQMIERNKFSRQSIQVDQARTLDVRRQAATVGSIADYMEVQEFGGVKAKGGAVGVPLATSYAAGQALGSEPRTRLARKPNRLESIRLQHRRKRGKGRVQQNLIAIKQAATSGRKFVFLNLGRRQGIFRVIGGARRPRLRMVWDMTQQSVVIPRNPWLLPATQRITAVIPFFYREALIFQLRRNNLFR